MLIETAILSDTENKKDKITVCGWSCRSGVVCICHYNCDSQHVMSGFLRLWRESVIKLIDSSFKASFFQVITAVVLHTSELHLVISWVFFLISGLINPCSSEVNDQLGALARRNGRLKLLEQKSRQEERVRCARFAESP